MATKTYKPTTPSRRHMATPSFEEITKKTPEKSLITILKKHAGRNNTGRITVRHQGGGNKKKYRIIDFKRQSDLANTVTAIEQDQTRNVLQDSRCNGAYCRNILRVFLYRHNAYRADKAPQRSRTPILRDHRRF